MSSSGVFVSAGPFSFRYDLGSPAMTADDGKAIEFAPPFAVANLVEDDWIFQTSMPTCDGAGPSKLERSTFDTFAKTMFRTDPHPYPSWISNPFTFSRRRRSYFAQSAHPTFFVGHGPKSRAFDRLMSAGKRITQGRSVFDETQFFVHGYQSRKGYGGGSAVLNLKNIEVTTGSPPGTQVATPCLGLTHDRLGIWFAPALVAVFTDVGDVANGAYEATTAVCTYDSVKVEVKENSLISNTYLQGEELLGTTWQYVNKNGSPDRRYSHNPQLAVVRTWELDLIGKDFRVDMQFTIRGIAQELADAMLALK